jgi:RNA polymerase sigma factor for flagellar operon FliA
VEEKSMPKRSTSNGRLDQSQKAQRDRVILDHLALVKAIALRIHETLPVHVELDDLTHAGVLGLIDAVTKYEPERNVAFGSYAKYRIRGAILDSLRQLDWASRDVRRRQKKVEVAERELQLELQRAPTESEIAEKMGVDVERWRQMMLGSQGGGLVSMSSRGSDQEDLPAPDYPANAETQPDNISARTQLHALLWGAMRKLPERYQKVLLLYYTKDLTMREVGEVLGVKESRVSQIHKSALQKMAVALQSLGIHASRAF